MSIAQLAARARRLKRQRGLDLMVVDYIQLLSGSTRRAMEGRVQEVTEITTGLKASAKELNVPSWPFRNSPAKSKIVTTSDLNSPTSESPARSSRTRMS